MSKRPTAKKRRRARWMRLRFRKGDPAHNLQAAVQHWVHANGGRLTIVGAIEVQQWPDDRAYLFSVAVKCLGLPPQPKAPAGAAR